MKAMYLCYNSVVNYIFVLFLTSRLIQGDVTLNVYIDNIIFKVFQGFLGV